ncbi:MAG: TolC family protein [Paludibacter sp.]|nr:TolC family protein [Paludibacter sp.]
MRKQILFILLAVTCQLGLNGQNLTVETCQEKAKANYPLVKQYGLIEQTAQYTISNANKGYLPQLALSVKATYQSDVTKIPSALGDAISSLTHKPFSFASLPQDQYQAVLEASQLIWDGGIISSQNKITKAGVEVEKQKLEVDLYTLKDRVNQLFFGILLLNEQFKQNEILKKDLQTNYERLSAYKQNGVAQQSDLDAIQVEQLNANQRTSDLNNTRTTYCLLLSALTGLSINDKTELQKPPVDLKVLDESTVRRPEVGLFDAQNKLYENQKDLFLSANLPKIGAFVQGGYGQPGLNMFAGGFSPFYIGGLRLSWNISGFYTQKDNLNKLDVSKKNVEIQKETFLFNNNLVTKQQQNEITKLQSTISNDDEIIRLRQNIKKATSVKLENGTATVSDLIRDVNAENQALQLKSLHEIQLLMNVYQLKNNINN